MLWLLLFRRAVGFDPNTYHGPFTTFLTFAEYLLPLAVLELYLFAQDGGGAVRRFAAATVLFVLTLGMGAGVFGVATMEWLPSIRAAFDARKSTAPPLAAALRKLAAL